MLTARLDDKIVNALEMDDRKALYICPTCGDPVILAKGKIKIHHFRHQEHAACIRTGETLDHLKTKADIYTKLKANPDIEIVEAECTRFEGIRPDIAFKHKKYRRWVGVEIQQSPISRDDIIDRCLRYQNNEVVIMWVLPESVYTKITNNDELEFRFTEWQKDLMYLHNGLFIFSGDFMVFMTFKNAIRTRQLYNANTGEYYGEKDEELKSTFWARTINKVFFEDLKCNTKSFCHNGQPFDLYNPITIEQGVEVFRYSRLYELLKEKDATLTDFLNSVTAEYMHCIQQYRKGEQ